VEASLKRLDTLYINLLQIYRFNLNTPIKETMKALHDLVQSGKVRYIGASLMRCWQFAEMNKIVEHNRWMPFMSMQNEYSLLYCKEVCPSFPIAFMYLLIMTMLDRNMR
jgi:aryl-alcohol dehydrogenase-like predicted oxidoreductase